MELKDAQNRMGEKKIDVWMIEWTLLLQKKWMIK